MKTRETISLLESATGLRGDETLLVLSSRIRSDLAEMILDRGESVTSQTHMITVPETTEPGFIREELPGDILSSVDVIVLVLSEQVGPGGTLAELRDETSCRVLEMTPGLTPDHFLDLEKLSLCDQIQKEGERVRKEMGKGDVLKLTDGDQSSFVFRPQGDRIQMRTCYAREDRSYGEIPNTYMYVPVDTKSVTGQLFISREQGEKSPVYMGEKWHVVNGHLQSESGGEHLRLSQDVPAEVDGLAIGLLPETSGVDDVLALFPGAMGKGEVHLILSGEEQEHRTSPLRDANLRLDLGYNQIRREETLVDVPVHIENDQGPDRDEEKEDSTQREIARTLDSSPEIYNHLFRLDSDPVYLLDRRTGKFLTVNPAFEEITGYSCEELRAGDIHRSQILQFDRMDSNWFSELGEDQQETGHIEMTLSTRSGSKLPVEVSIRSLTLWGRNLELGRLRDLTEYRAEKRGLKDQIRKMAERNSQIYRLTESIQKILESMSEVLNYDETSEILATAAEFLCSQRGLGFHGVSFYLLNEEKEHLERAHSTLEKEREEIPMEEDHELVRAGEGEIVSGESPDLYVPLRGRETIMGVFHVRLTKKQNKLMREQESVWNNFQEVLGTLSHLMGLVIQNQKLHRSLHQRSMEDELTELPNRRYFNQKLEEEVNRSQRYGNPLTLLILDLDDFKSINDSYGHLVGDQILKKVGEKLQKNTRTSDHVCRYGGDEFVILLTETGPEAGRKKAEALQRRFRNYSFSPEKEEMDDIEEKLDEIGVSCSIGMSSLTGEEEEVAKGETLLKVADRAMYRAKQEENETLLEKDFEEDFDQDFDQNMLVGE